MLRAMTLHYGSVELTRHCTVLTPQPHLIHVLLPFPITLSFHPAASLDTQHGSLPLRVIIISLCK